MNEAIKSLKTLPGSKTLFFKNGKCEGVAFTDIYGGCYYPAMALHKSVTVSANFGPKFKYPNVLKEYNSKGVSHEQKIVWYIFVCNIQLFFIKNIYCNTYDLIFL